jgi:hypothetical protein
MPEPSVPASLGDKLDSLEKETSNSMFGVRLLLNNARYGLNETAKMTASVYRFIANPEEVPVTHYDKVAKGMIDALDAKGKAALPAHRATRNAP